MKETTAQEAVKCIQSNNHVFIHSAACAPQLLVNAMSARASDLRNVTIHSIHTEGKAPYADASMEGIFQINPLFIGKNIRDAVNSNRGSYIPVFLSEAPDLFRSGALPVDVALISVSLPDKHGFCSLGPAVDISLAAVQNAKIIIAQMSPHVPRVQGDGFIHVSKLNYIVPCDELLFSPAECPITPEEALIGKHVANLVEDGATLQMGIGSIPNAVLAALDSHKNLGIHSEMFSDGILPLVEKGVINGSRKEVHRNEIIASFAVGSQRLYDFMNDNPQVKLYDFAYVNNLLTIMRNPKVTAINSAIELDLTGQVCADSIGSYLFSGVGGQIDYMHGAAFSDGGKPIIALTSTTKRGESKIVPYLKTGAGVVTTRAHVHWVVTEYGAVNLHGKSLHQRAELLISIAHPDHRDALANGLKDGL